MGRKERKWHLPRASVAAGNDKEGQQPAWHRWGMAQRHGDSEATQMSDTERRRAVHRVKAERGSYRGAEKKVRGKNGLVITTVRFINPGSLMD